MKQKKNKTKKTKTKKSTVTLTAGPGGVSSSTWAQMLRIFSRWEKSCSTITTRVRSDRPAQGSSILLALPLVLVLAAPPSSSPAQGFRMHLGATAEKMMDKLLFLSEDFERTVVLDSRIRSNLMHITHQQANCHRAEVHPGVQRDPVETRQRRVKTGPCWPFPLSEFSAQDLEQMRW